MKLQVITAGTIGGVERSTATLEVDGATLFFVDGAPVAYLHAGTVYHAGDLQPVLAAFPVLQAAGAHRTNTRELETRLVFRERSANQTLNAAFAGMPFAPILNFETGGGALDFEQIAGNVRSLAGFLRDHVQADDARDRELDDYRKAAAGVATFFRLAGLLSAPADPT